MIATESKLDSSVYLLAFCMHQENKNHCFVSCYFADPMPVRNIMGAVLGQIPAKIQYVHKLLLYMPLYIHRVYHICVYIVWCPTKCIH